jgi:hypothetical protein
VENKVLASVNGGKVFATIGGKVYLCTQVKETANYLEFGLPNGNSNLANILVKPGVKNISPVRLEAVERKSVNAKFDKFAIGKYGDNFLASVYTPKTTRSGKANRPIAHQAQAVASKSGKANKALMAEILATQAHLAELIASIS